MNIQSIKDLIDRNTLFTGGGKDLWLPYLKKEERIIQKISFNAVSLFEKKQIGVDKWLEWIWTLLFHMIYFKERPFLEQRFVMDFSVNFSFGHTSHICNEFDRLLFSYFIGLFHPLDMLFNRPCSPFLFLKCARSD